MPIMKTVKQTTFREIGGLWLAVDSAQPKPPNLAKYLQNIDLQIDDSCVFGRFIRYNNNIKYTIIYRAWNSQKITITIYKTNIQ